MQCKEAKTAAVLEETDGGAGTFQNQNCHETDGAFTRTAPVPRETQTLSC